MAQKKQKLFLEVSHDGTQYTARFFNREGVSLNLVGNGGAEAVPSFSWETHSGIVLPPNTSKVYRMELIPQRKKVNRQ